MIKHICDKCKIEIVGQVYSLTIDGTEFHLDSEHANWVINTLN
jgi:hypothetical protein